VVWHPSFAGGQKLAQFLYDQLTRDSQQPVSRGIGIQVYFRTATPGADLPEPIPLDQASHTAVVVLVDDEMVAARPIGWDRYVADLWQQTHVVASPHRLLPVMLTQTALSLAPQVSEANFIRLHRVPSDRQPVRLLISVAHELCRLLLNEPRVEHTAGERTPRLNEPVKVFISHAKKDGEALAEAIRDHISKSEQLDTFFDANKIPFGSSFPRTIKDEFKNERTALLVVQTDEYSTREWCQREVLYAKQQQRPLLVVHAVRVGEKRGFPYLGNAPVLRYVERTPPDYEMIVAQLLLEVLRTEHFLQQFHDIRELFRIPAQSVRCLPQAPELLTLVALRSRGEQATTFVYPDPPLGEQELDLFHALDDRIRVTTPILLLAHGERLIEAGHAAAGAGTSAGSPVVAAATATGSASSLAGQLIGLSISEVPELEFLRRGFARAHLDDAMVEFARYVLAARARLAYGGDLRTGGFTETLHDLIRIYNAESSGPQQFLKNFLAWTIYVGLDAAKRAAFAAAADLVPVPPPADLQLGQAASFDPKAPDAAYVQARCLTAMREEMTRQIGARVLLGGKQTGFSGRYPGLAEEAYLAVKAGKPLYLLGGFGGCTGAVIEALRGRVPPLLTEHGQVNETPTYRSRIDDFNRRAPAGVEPVDYDLLVRTLRDKNVAGLSRDNGLTVEENERLFETIHSVEMVYLVLKGLLQLAQEGRLRSAQ
jgi:hypothetical protein